MIINQGVLRLRLFDIGGAYLDLQRAAEVGTDDVRLDILTRCAAEKASRGQIMTIVVSFASFKI